VHSRRLLRGLDARLRELLVAGWCRTANSHAADDLASPHDGNAALLNVTSPAPAPAGVTVIETGLPAGKVESGLYNNASEVVREGLRLLKEHDEIRVKWREQIERGWLQAQAGQVVDGDAVFHQADERIKQRRRKRAR